MRNTVLVVLVVLLATILSPSVSFGNIDPCAPPNSPNSMEYARKAEIMNREARREESRRYDYSSHRGNSSYDNRGSNYGYSSERHGNSSRTGISIGLGAKIGGVRVNLGYSKTTYSKPKPRYQPQSKVIVVNRPIVVVPKQCRMTLVQEVGDGLETISPIVVTNPEKVLVAGTSIVFSRNGEFFAEYAVLRVSGDSVFVETVDAPRGNPRQGDTFQIISAE